MTAIEIAARLHARKVGKGRWTAKCPAHPDRYPSLSIAVGKKVPVVLKCMSRGCSTKAILAALGLTWADLFWDRQAPLEVRERLTWEEQREKLERQLGLVAVLQALEPGKRAYWFGAEKRIRGELDLLRCRLEPEKVWQAYRDRMFQARVRRLGWERIWKEEAMALERTTK